MNMKECLIESFYFNDQVNRVVLEKTKLLPEKKEAIRYFSHLVNSLNKWMARIL